MEDPPHHLVVDNDVVKVLRDETVKRKLDHEWELELIGQKLMNKDQDLKAEIEGLTNVVGVDSKYQG